MHAVGKQSDKWKLPPAVVNSIRNAQRELQVAIDIIARKEACGVNCDDMKREVESIYNELQLYVQHFA